MARKNISVYGIYPDRLKIEEAVDALRRNEFRSTDVSVLLPETEGTKDIGTERHTKAPEGAVTGSIPGAGL